MKAKVLLTIVVFAISACSKDAKETSKEAQHSSVSTNVIYGDDNRLDLFEVQNALYIQLAASTAVLVENSSLKDQKDGTYIVEGEGFGESFGLCKTESYYNQPSGGFCSGFLVGPRTVVTAGHCVSSKRDCKTTSFVFDYGYKNSVFDPSRRAKDDVYACAKVIKTRYTGAKTDFAVIELDRDVIGRSPLKLRTEGLPVVGDSLVVIGHPSGLPTKVADGASVREVKASKQHFVANLDTYGGNSGSAVFNATSGEVEGILVRGERDFVYDQVNKCMKSNYCENDKCRGEDVTLTSEFLKYL